MEPTPTSAPPRSTRRKFLRRTLWGVAGLLGAAGLGTAYGFWEASQIRIKRETISLANLPTAFHGRTIAILTDFHHGPFVSMDFIRRAVALAQELKPDAFMLLGDFAHKGTHATEQLPPCLEAVSKLQAPLGVFAIPGNHDMQAQGEVYREAIRHTPLTDLTNRSVRLSLNGQFLSVAGVDDLWWGKPDLKTALKEVPKEEAVILLSHNPDFAEVSPDPRVSLMLSGHTHGGQAYLPGVGSIFSPSRYGSKYLAGLVQGPASRVFVSRGLGEAGVPMRLNCPPEINLLTLSVSEVVAKRNDAK
jgi:uncharacterized protein